MTTRSADPPRHLSRPWNRLVVRAKQKLHRANGRDGQTQNATTEDSSKAQLGKFASEDQMPAWLRRYLLSHHDNSKDGIINMLQAILNDSSETKSACLAHPSVLRITKLRHEGSFCGYRNIQMLISHLILATETGPRTFPDGVPSIFQLQDQIEAAWDHGYNSRGRDETGGIRGTRKFIGTQEAQALFSYLKVNCSALRYQDSREISAVDQVFDAIESYYQCSLTKPEDARNKVQCTMLAPIYFQRPGHSLTVIGLQKTMHNERHLLVFNPGHRYKDTPPSLPQRQRPDVLEPYRLRAESLRKYSEFELL